MSSQGMLNKLLQFQPEGRTGLGVHWVPLAGGGAQHGHGVMG